MNLVEWLIYAAALDHWSYIGGHLQVPEYEATRIVVMIGDKITGHRQWSRLPTAASGVPLN